MKKIVFVLVLLVILFISCKYPDDGPYLGEKMDFFSEQFYDYYSGYDIEESEWTDTVYYYQFSAYTPVTHILKGEWIITSTDYQYWLMDYLYYNPTL